MNTMFIKQTAHEAGSKIFQASFLSGYNLSIFLGFLIAFFTVAYFWHRNKIAWEHLQILMIIMMPSAILGARIYALITMTDPDWHNFFNFSGLSIYGGVIGAILSGSIYVYLRRHTLDYRTVLSIMLPTILIGQAMGRWGNFSNHELFGQVVTGDSLNWMGSLKEHMNIYPAGGWVGSAEYRAPIFFYEFIGTLLAYILIVWVLLDRNWLKPGVTGMLYFIAYGIIRMILQTQRADVPGSVDYFPGTKVPMNYITSGIGIAAGLGAAIWWQFLGEKAHKMYKWIPYKKYELITPVKEVRRIWVGPKYERAFRIWLPIPKESLKTSKREINNKISKLQNKQDKKNNKKLLKK